MREVFYYLSGNYMRFERTQSRSDKMCLWSEAIYIQYGILVQILWDNFSTDILRLFYSKKCNKKPFKPNKKNKMLLSIPKSKI